MELKNTPPLSIYLYSSVFHGKYLHAKIYRLPLIIVHFMLIFKVGLKICYFFWQQMLFLGMSPSTDAMI